MLKVRPALWGDLPEDPATWIESEPMAKVPLNVTVTAPVRAGQASAATPAGSVSGGGKAMAPEVG